MDTSLDVPIISDEELSKIASSFLKKHDQPDLLPIHIEQICDKEGVGLLIVPDLTSLKDTEAYITNNCEVIVMDQNVFETQIDRARFGIAHELSHRILHTAHLEQFPISDAASYETFHNAVSADNLTVIEDQAYSLAGHLLMPTTLLNAEIDRLIKAEGNNELTDSVIQRVVRTLAAIFMVSIDALLRQVEKVNSFLHQFISKEIRAILVPPYVKTSVWSSQAIAQI
jgi:Zn-dependent peptidase ImmA (M78 family)